MAAMQQNTQWPRSLYGTEVRVYGVPYCYGQGKTGVEHGPRCIREYGTVKAISEMGYNVKDCGDIVMEDVGEDPYYANVRHPKAIGKANKVLADEICSSLKGGAKCLTLGGDHSLAIGSIIGQSMAQPDFGVVWVDAHADLNPPQASPSGNTHGMPVAFLVKEMEDLIPKNIPGFEWIHPCIKAKDVAYLGLRDLDLAEKEFIEEHNMTAYGVDDILEIGLSAAVKEAVAVASNNNTRPVHLSFDIDALDPSVAPSTGTPVPGGLALREGVYIVEKVAATGLLSVMDLVEVNPAIGSEEDKKTTLLAAQEIITGWFGRRNRKQISPGYSIPKP